MLTLSIELIRSEGQRINKGCEFIDSARIFAARDVQLMNNLSFGFIQIKHSNVIGSRRI